MTLEETAAVIADALEDGLTADVEDLQVTAFLNPFPTPPSIDVYPAPEFFAPLTQRRRAGTWTVRARVGTADHEAGQKLLYQLMEPGKVWKILRDLGLSATGPSGFNVYDDPNPTLEGGQLIGCEWTVTLEVEVDENVS